MELSAAEVAALEGGAVRVGVFFRLALDAGPLRLWLGIGKIEPGVNVLDLTGAEYLGAGEIVDVPVVNQLINGVAERVSFRLSGVSESILPLADAENRAAVKGRAVNVGVALFGNDWQLLGSVKWLWRGVADYLSASQEGASEPGGQTVRAVELSVGSLMTGRRRAGLSYLTDADQHRRSPGDRFAERTARYSQESTKKWPPA
jgi:hypothetical protein